MPLPSPSSWQSRRRAGCLGAVCAAGLAGCALVPRPAPAPLPAVELEPAAPGGETCLVVFLPGRGDVPEDFRRQGFARLARERGVRCDLVAVDAHLGYYRNRTVIERLHRDVIAPARARGVAEVWLVGISLGGLGSLLYLAEHPGEAAGAVLLAPFLGEDIVDEVAAAGGLSRWDPGPAAPESVEGFERRLWRFLRTAFAAGEAGRPAARVYLGWGEDDSFARANGLLAAALPADAVETAPGGHDWPPWRTLWTAFLDRGVLRSGGSAAAAPRGPG